MRCVLVLQQTSSERSKSPARCPLSMLRRGPIVAANFLLLLLQCVCLSSSATFDVPFSVNATGSFSSWSISNPRVPQATTNDTYCVRDVLDPDTVLRNTSINYITLVDLFKFKSLRTCTYVLPQVVNAGDDSRQSFVFAKTRVTTVSNATTEVVQCGLACHVTLQNGTVVDETVQGTRHTFPEQTLNTTTVLNASTWAIVDQTVVVIDNFTRVACAVGTANTSLGPGFDSGVCTAFVQYNDTYWENGTVYAFPRNLTARVNGDLTLSHYPSRITFELGELTTCPWYLTAHPAPAEPIDSRLYSILDGPYVTFNISYKGAGVWGNESLHFLADVALLNLTCTVVTSGAGSRASFEGALGYSESDSFFSDLYIPSLRVVPSVTLWKIRPVYWGPSTSLVEHDGSVRLLPVMQANVSGWAPLEDYSTPALSQQRSRCYVATPRGADGTPTTLGGLFLQCRVRQRFNIATNIINATTFCCYDGFGSAGEGGAHSWLNVIEVVTVVRSQFLSEEEVWFVDGVGITAPPMMTPVPKTLSPGAAGNGTGTNDSSTATPAPGGSSDGVSGSSSSDGSVDAAAILGGTLAGVVVVSMAIALFYFRVWKPRQEEIDADAAKNAASGVFASLRRPAAAADAPPVMPMRHHPPQWSSSVLEVGLLQPSADDGDDEDDIAL